MVKNRRRVQTGLVQQWSQIFAAHQRTAGPQRSVRVNIVNASTKRRWILYVYVLLLIVFVKAFERLFSIRSNHGMREGSIRCEAFDNGLTFHYVLTRGSYTVRQSRSVDSVFFFHPDACVFVHYNSRSFIQAKNLEMFSYRYTEKRFCFRLFPYDIGTVLDSILESSELRPSAYLGLRRLQYLQRRGKLIQHRYWYSHETDLMRYYILHTHGGWYLDSDVIVLQKLDSVRDVIGKEDADNLNGAVLHASCGHCFASSALNLFLATYSPTKPWGHVGPALLTKMHVGKALSEKCKLRVLPVEAFESVHYSNMASALIGEEKKFSSGVYAFHYNNKIVSQLISLKSEVNTLQYQLLNKYCVLCEDNI